MLLARLSGLPTYVAEAHGKRSVVVTVYGGRRLATRRWGRRAVSIANHARQTAHDAAAVCLCIHFFDLAITVPIPTSVRCRRRHKTTLGRSGNRAAISRAGI